MGARKGDNLGAHERLFRFCIATDLGGAIFGGALRAALNFAGVVSDPGALTIVRDFRDFRVFG